MSFTIKFEPKAEKILLNLQKNIALRIIKKLESVALDPFHYLKHFAGAKVHKLRIGEYRALIDIDNKENI